MPRLKQLRFWLLAPSLRVNPRNNRRAAIYAEKRLIYNRIKKSGNSTILLFLDEIVYGTQSSGLSYRTAKNASVQRTVTPFDLPAGEIRRLDDYYKFTIFRNPYSRCLSMFLNKVAPGASPGYSSVAGFGDKSAAGFEKFVTFLARGGINANPHFYPQTRLLFFEPKYFSQIGKLENLDLELRRVCKNVNLPYPDNLQASEPHHIDASAQGRITKADEKLKMYYTKELYSRVRDLYISDFEVGRYDTEPPI
jgi:hypothetical protein